MEVQILLFGITTDLLNTKELLITLEENSNVAEFKKMLSEKYPQLKSLPSYAVAVNEAYADDSLLLKKNDIIAIIPPVSGG
ncbi:MoaD/ThiS family protein [Tenacibaculum geojense]|uniref:Molybdopterin synthase sulfur carrier subunit n=1 Tax=Tenacibaculum geojense TaxID=915352 RepID=A0ABW3JTR2_9FLAO